MPDATHRSREVEGSDRGRLIALPAGDRHEIPPHNLPLGLSSFVGREEELAEIRRLLAAALADIFHRPKEEINGSKWLWSAVAAMNYMGIGPIVYFGFGQKR